MRSRRIDHSINFLLLRNTSVASLTASVGQKSVHSLDQFFWLKVFHEAVVKQLSCLLAVVLSEDSSGGGSASKLTYTVVVGIQFLAEFGLRSLVPC